MNLGQLRAAAKGGYALPETEADPRLTDAQWNRAINRGYNWLARQGRMIAGKWTNISPVAGTREYSLASLSPGLAEIQFVYFKQGGTDGSWRPLTPFPADQQTRGDDAWHEGTGSPQHYYLRGLSLGLRPTPDADNAGPLFLEIWGWALPVPLTADDQIPEIPEHLHELLLDPARYEMAKQEALDGRGDAPVLVQMLTAHRQEALNELLQFMNGLTAGPRFVDMTHDYDF
jgi:hypothetical protein